MSEIINVYKNSGTDSELGFEPDSVEIVDNSSWEEFDEVDLIDLYMLVCLDCKKQIPLDIVEFKYFESQIDNEDDFVCEKCADVRIFSEFESSPTSH